MSKFADQIKASRDIGGEARVKAAETFVAAPPVVSAPPAPPEEPRRQLNIRIPESIYEEIRKVSFESRTPMQDLIVEAWKLAHPNV